MAMPENKQQDALTTVMVPVYIMGKRYDVPEGLTIMKAMEFAGFKYIRGCGCRGGICGACGTVYRKPGDYKIYTALACQTAVEPDMYLAQLPFYPALHQPSDFAACSDQAEEIHKLYPELFRCVACNACRKVCPMDVEVMDIIGYVKRGDLSRAAHESFDCIQCGLCTSRCFAEMPQYHIMQLARRIYGAKIAPMSKHTAEAARAIREGKFDDMMDEVMRMGTDELKKVYVEREIEPETASEDWRPQEGRYLLKEQQNA